MAQVYICPGTSPNSDMEIMLYMRFVREKVGARNVKETMMWYAEQIDGFCANLCVKTFDLTIDCTAGKLYGESVAEYFRKRTYAKYNSVPAMVSVTYVGTKQCPICMSARSSGSAAAAAAAVSSSPPADTKDYKVPHSIDAPVKSVLKSDSETSASAVNKRLVFGTQDTKQPVATPKAPASLTESMKAMTIDDSAGGPQVLNAPKIDFSRYFPCPLCNFCGCIDAGIEAPMRKLWGAAETELKNTATVCGRTEAYVQQFAKLGLSVHRDVLHVHFTQHGPNHADHWFRAGVDVKARTTPVGNENGGVAKSCVVCATLNRSGDAYRHMKAHFKTVPFNEAARDAVDTILWSIPGAYSSDVIDHLVQEVSDHFTYHDAVGQSRGCIICVLERTTDELNRYIYSDAKRVCQMGSPMDQAARYAYAMKRFDFIGIRVKLKEIEDHFANHDRCAAESTGGGGRSGISVSEGILNPRDGCGSAAALAVPKATAAATCEEATYVRETCPICLAIPQKWSEPDFREYYHHLLESWKSTSASSRIVRETPTRATHHFRRFGVETSASQLSLHFAAHAITEAAVLAIDADARTTESGSGVGHRQSAVLGTIDPRRYRTEWLGDEAEIWKAIVANGRAGLNMLGDVLIRSKNVGETSASATVSAASASMTDTTSSHDLFQQACESAECPICYGIVMLGDKKPWFWRFHTDVHGAFKAFENPEHWRISAAVSRGLTKFGITISQNGVYWHFTHHADETPQRPADNSRLVNASATAWRSVNSQKYKEQLIDAFAEFEPTTPTVAGKLIFRAECLGGAAVERARKALQVVDTADASSASHIPKWKSSEGERLASMLRLGCATADVKSVDANTSKPTVVEQVPGAGVVVMDDGGCVRIVGDSKKTVPFHENMYEDGEEEMTPMDGGQVRSVKPNPGVMGYSLIVTKYSPVTENRMERTVDIRDSDRKVTNATRGTNADCVVFRVDDDKTGTHRLCIGTNYQLIEIASNSKWQQHVEACALEYECDFTALFGRAKNPRVEILYACWSRHDADYIQRKICEKWKKDNSTGKIDLRGCFEPKMIVSMLLYGPCPWAKKYIELVGKKSPSDPASAAAQSL